VTIALTIGRNLTSALYLPVFIVASFVLFIVPFVGMISGVAFVSAIVFVILKAVGVLAWSWLWVLAPAWIMAAYFVLMFISPVVMRYTVPTFGKVGPDDPEILWTERHLNWTLGAGYAIGFVWALIIGDAVSLLLNLPDTLAALGDVVSFVVSWGLWSALAVLLGIWYLKRKGRSPLHLLWWVTLATFPVVLLAGYLPDIPVLGLVGIGIMFCLHNKTQIQPSARYATDEQLTDDADYIVMNCGACFRQYKVARGQGIIASRCPNCGREATIGT